MHQQNTLQYNLLYTPLSYSVSLYDNDGYIVTIVITTYSYGLGANAA